MPDDVHDAPLGKVESLDPRDLDLDPKNPRLRRDEQGADQRHLLQVMIDRFKVEELAESIVKSGFIGFDPILAYNGENSVIVLEGNRRLAAIKLLLNPELAPEASVRTWQALSRPLCPDERSALERIKVTVFPNRKDVSVRAYIGFRHVTGVLQWQPLEKAAYIADLLEGEGWTYSEIADRLGSYPRHVERHYVAHQIVVQALDTEIDGAYSMRDSFGVLMRALQAAGVRKFIGVEFPNQPAESKVPVPDSKTENFRLFVRWTFGTREAQPLLRDSRQLTKWGRILSVPAALGYLKRTPNPDFDRAWLKAGGQADSVSNALYTAADRLEESVPLVSELVDDAQVTAAVRQCARFLQQILRYFPAIAERHGFPTMIRDHDSVYELPELHVGEISVFADWVELCALSVPSGSVSKAWVADVVRDAGLLGNAEEGGFVGDDLYGSSVDFSGQDALSTFTDELWRVLTARALAIGPGYHYRLSGETFRLRVSAWQEVPIHTLLLLCDVGRRYSPELRADGAEQLFEVAVAVAARRLFGGRAVRFGWPRTPSWPTGIQERVERLAEDLGLHTEDLSEKLDPKSKDIGLDVAARLSFGDDEPGTATFLIQCATGKNWKAKTGEPSITEWRDLLRWNSLLIRAVAVPWRLEPPDDYLRTFKRFDSAIVLDRLRLLAANAEDLLPQQATSEILRWCGDRLSRIPKLAG